LDREGYLQGDADPFGPALDEFFQDIARKEGFPAQTLIDALETEGLIEVAKRLGFTRENRRRLSRNSSELASAVAEVFGFPPLLPPYSLQRMVEQVEALNARLKDHLKQEAPDNVVVRGCVASVFRLLERALRELLDFYFRWRFGEDEAQLEIWLTDKRHLRAWQQGEVTLGTYRAILSNIETVLRSQPDEGRALERDFGRSYFINPSNSTRLQSLTALPDVARENLEEIEEIKVSIDRRNAVIHWTEQDGQRETDLLDAIEKVYDFLGLAIGQIFPEVVTVIEQGNHYTGGRYTRIFNDRGEHDTISCSEPLEFHPTQYYFARGNQPIFIKRRYMHEETK
jgi:hypothetical protein